MKWPVTIGVHGSMSFDNSSIVEIIYISGHENGTVKVWDASVPFLGLLCSVENEVRTLLQLCLLGKLLTVVGDKPIINSLHIYEYLFYKILLFDLQNLMYIYCFTGTKSQFKSEKCSHFSIGVLPNFRYFGCWR